VNYACSIKHGVQFAKLRKLQIVASGGYFGGSVLLFHADIALPL
jgi:hypothetical protein